MSMAGAHPHHYRVEVEWTGNLGAGTRGYRDYSRDHEIRIAGKPALAGSSDPAFRGDPGRHNPEDMLVAALSTCHMLSYLHMATVAGVVTIDAGSDPAKALAAHDDAHHACFIANSVNFPVRCEPRIVRTETNG